MPRWKDKKEYETWKVDKIKKPIEIAENSSPKKKQKMKKDDKYLILFITAFALIIYKPVIFLPLALLASIFFWFAALVDILKNEFTGSNKLIWALMVIFIPILGFILYFTIGRDQKINTSIPQKSNEHNSP